MELSQGADTFSCLSNCLVCFQLHLDSPWMSFHSHLLSPLRYSSTLNSWEPRVKSWPYQLLWISIAPSTPVLIHFFWLHSLPRPPAMNWYFVDSFNSTIRSWSLLWDFCQAKSLVVWASNDFLFFLIQVAMKLRGMGPFEQHYMVWKYAFKIAIMRIHCALVDHLLPLHS